MKPSELLAKPEAWTRESEARQADGYPVLPESATACKWCIIGAIRKCARKQVDVSTWSNKVAILIGGGIESWNDMPGRTHAEVLELLRRDGP